MTETVRSVNRPVCGEREVGVGAVQGVSRAGVKVDSEGEHYAQGQGFQALPGVRVEHGTGTEAHVGHGDHLRNEGKNHSLAQEQRQWSFQESTKQFNLPLMLFMS